jgi:non-homologous end joining protein Ku
MRAEKMVGIARVVLFRRERLLMLEPRGKGLVGISLHYANEVHQDSGYFEEIPDIDIPREMLDLAKHIITKMTGKFDPSEFEDRYENALIELIRSKQKGTPIKPQPTHRQANVINLMDALRRSVDAEKGHARQEVLVDDGRQGEGQAARSQDRISHAGLSIASRLPPETQLHPHQGAARQAAAAHRRPVRRAQA